MRKITASMLFVVLLSSCVWPHKEWVTPPATGCLRDTLTHQPIANALVTRIAPQQARTQTKTDIHGNFELSGIQEIRWISLDAVPLAVYRFEADGYQRFEQRRSSSGWSYRKDLLDQIGEIQLSPK